MAGQVLADMGAEVIKVESIKHMDGLRKGRPLQVDDTEGGDKGLWPNQQPTFHSLNRNKKSIVLDLTQPAAVAIFEKLVAESDVVMNNFAPAVMDRLGLGWDRLSSLNPRLVMCEQSAAGRTGPWRDLVAYANGMHALAGLSSVVGYEGEPPLGSVATPYADATAAMASATAILAGLWQRDQTGIGQYIEVSGVEALVTLCAELVLTASMAGEDLKPVGNKHRRMVPYGIYPTNDDDTWISIAVGDDEEWRRLVAVATETGLDEGRFANLAGRSEHEAEINDRLAAWTKGFEITELTSMLAEQDLAAFPVRDISGLYFCEHHQVRETFPTTEHPHVGYEPLPGLAWKMHGTPGDIRRVAPDLGEHTEQVLTDLGYSRDEIAALAADETIFCSTIPDGVNA